MDRKTQRKKSSRAVWLVAGVAVVAASVLVTLSILSSREQAPGRDQPGTEPLVDLQMSDEQLGASRRAIGPDGAKVTVIEYLNYV